MLEAQGAARASPEVLGDAIAVLGRVPAAIGAKDGLPSEDFVAGRLDAEHQIGAESAFGTASSGNGGTASANADAGVITVGDINSGGNQGTAGDIGNVGEPIESIEDAAAAAAASEAPASEKEKEVKKTVTVELAQVAEKNAAAPTEEEADAPVEQGRSWSRRGSSPPSTRKRSRSRRRPPSPPRGRGG